MATEEIIDVTVACSPAPREVHEIRLQLPQGATVAQAIEASGVASVCPSLDLNAAPVGVWGRKAVRTQRLRMNDRVEIYRSLRVDPKVARRERFAKQGARTAGLFASRRAGAKAGY